VDWIEVAQDGWPLAGFCSKGYEPSSSIIGGKCFE